MFFLFCAFSWQKPCETTWGNGLEAMKHALVLEKDVYQALLDLHNTAARSEDPQVGSIHSIRVLFDWVSQAITTVNQKKGNTFKSQWELEEKITKPPKARENVGDQVIIFFISLASDWLRERCKFSAPNTEWGEAKTIQSQITFNS